MRSEDVLREVEQFLYREARLLDERRFNEWLDLFTDDVRYWMGARANPYPRRERRGFLCRRAAGSIAPRRWRLENRAAQNDARSERAVGQERQHFLLENRVPAKAGTHR